MWKVVDFEDGTGTPYQKNRVECIADGIAARAIAEGNNYELDCSDPNEEVPLIFVADNDETGEITNQVIMSETKLSSMVGMCVCTEAPTTSPSAGPTTSPSAGPTSAPVAVDDRNGDFPDDKEDKTTASPTVVTTSVSTGAPTDVPSSSPSLSPSSLPSSLPSANPTSTGPTETPSGIPSSSPSAVPSQAPSAVPEQTSAPTDATLTPSTATPPAAPTTSPTGSTASGSGDPHFKTWTQDKFDYHGECDLILIHNPTFADGLGLRLHVRTTRVAYFSYIQEVALQIGEDVLQFNNDVENFLINGKVVEEQRRWHETLLAGYTVRRDKKAISVRLDKSAKAKIDFIVRKNGFPAVVVDGADTDLFKCSLGLLGEWSTGKKIARDGMTDMDDPDATDFALEWQVRDTEPMLFQEARLPQFPTTCTPPKKMMGNRLGRSHMEKEAEKACAHWKEDKEDCIFDCIATRSVLVAEEGSVSTVV
jgi:hypothetical protein